MKFLKKLLPLKTVPTKQDEAKAFYKELEVDVMARTLWGEARSEGVRGLEAVASVILNRVEVARKFAGYWWGNDIMRCMQCRKGYVQFCYKMFFLHSKSPACRIHCWYTKNALT